MKLNIYSGKKIIKTYEADTYDLKFGTLEDVANAINLDDLQTGSNTEIIKAAANLVMGSMETVKDLFKDIFDGITDEELRTCTVYEMANVLVDVVKYTMKLLSLNAKGN